MSDVRLKALNTPDTSSLELTSELFDASFNGRFKLSTLPASLKTMADMYVGYVPGSDPVSDTINQIYFQADLYRMNPILDFFFPKIQIAEQSKIQGTYIPAREIYEATGAFSELQIGPLTWSNAELLAGTMNREFDFRFHSESMVYGKNYALENQRLHLFTSNDTAHLTVTWDNQSPDKYSGDINLSGAFQADSLAERGFLVEVKPSDIYINNEKWMIDPSSVLLRKNYLNVDSLYVRSQAKHILADGTVASGGNQEFKLDFRNLNLDEMAYLLGANTELQGNMTGDFTYRETDGLSLIHISEPTRPTT